jgi:RNA polymerase sigma factor (sigma-70 family)
MPNPFKEKSAEHETDTQLIQGVLEGSRTDLEKLIFRHQAWIYNIALKMVLDPGDAEDITQEILIKLMTKLSLYTPEKGAFRTWLYRIVANHVINMKKRKCEVLATSFEECAALVENIPDASIDSLPENRILTEELKIKCWTSMLLCLNRKQRLVFILGGIFEVTDRVGSEILEMSRVNFRKLLSRARSKIGYFMEHKCGLIKKENPCNCSRKLGGFLKNGFVQADQISFFREDIAKIKDVIHENEETLGLQRASRIMQQFQAHPFYDLPNFEKWIGNLLQHRRLAPEFTRQPL